MCRSKHLHSWFESNVQQAPDSIALILGTESWTYAQLNVRANRIANRLIAMGVLPGQIVGLAHQRDADLLPSLLGILKAGAAYAPLDPHYPLDRLEFILQDCQAPAVVTTSEVAAKMELGEAQLLLVDQIDESADDSNPELRLDDQQLAYVIYTSGSTGKPKGVQVTHANATRLFTSTEPWFGFDHTDTWTLFHSFAFDFSVWEIWGALLYGGRLVMVPYEISRSPDSFYQLLSEQKVTVLNQTPSAFRQLILADEALHEQHALSLRYVIFGGEALEFSSLQSWVRRHGDQKPRLVNMYGITETTVHVTYRVLSSSEIQNESRSLIGEPIPDLQLHVLNDDLQPKPVGEVGEIYVGGAGVSLGYLNRPELTSERFLPNPFSEDSSARLYKTGDLGLFRADGELEYHGRSDRQVQLRGFRVELGEIEARLQAHSSVAQAIVIVRNEAATQQLVAYLVSARDKQIDSSELREQLGEKLPDYMIPQFFVPIEQIPLTANGKLDPAALPSPLEHAQLGNYVAPKTEAERKVAAVWQSLLGISKVTTTATFFELGGQSLMLAKMVHELKKDFPGRFALVDLFQYPTVRQLARFLTREADRSGESGPYAVGQYAAGSKNMGERPIDLNEPIAIVGMSGRFPDAENVEQFWNHLLEGHESIRQLSEAELLAAGVPLETIRSENYVPVTASLTEVDYFDAEFFGVSPYEAKITDPQHRLFLECAWSALESAGYPPESTDRRIGVFAGARPNSYRQLVHEADPDEIDPSTAFQTLISNEKDFLSTRVSHRLDLIGPSMTVQTGCSTSLVAVQLACQSLQTQQCSLALAGGVSVNLEYRNGYVSQEGMILSPDGHVRTFDEKAAGTVFSESVGIVVLKRLSDAVADRDTIHAVIRGIALNNDGGSKISYASPSVDGQTEVVAMAHRMSQLSADQVGFVEAHGTGTFVGDPIEVQSLTRAFQRSTDKKQFCALGSVKTNMGHADVAAGVIGLIKAANVVRDGLIPPSLHFETPNPNFSLEESPFFVVTEKQVWKNESGPRIAGVSSLGIGGTNAHAILMEYDSKSDSSETTETSEPPCPVGDSAGGLVWLPLSARDETALEKMSVNLAEYLQRHPELDLHDVAFTLNAGRSHFKEGRVVACRTREEAIAGLLGQAPESVVQGSCGIDLQSDPRSEVVFMFPGQGGQYVGMAQGLYQTLPSFRADVDYFCDIAKRFMTEDLREIMFAESLDDSQRQQMQDRLAETWLTQPALCIIELALARLWQRCGVQPKAVIGHSIGEFAAAAVAGVMSFESAIELTVLRGKLIFDLPKGLMLAVMSPVDEVKPHLTDGLSIAVLNSPQNCVVSGTTEEIKAFVGQLEKVEIASRVLHTSHGFHSSMMDPVLDEFRSAVEAVELSDPHTPIISTVTGDWVQPGEMSQSQYWARNIRETVQFSKGIQHLLTAEHVLLEVGPGQTLCSLVRRRDDFHSTAVRSTRHPKETLDDVVQWSNSLSELWIAGVDVMWPTSGKGGRIPLPTYPFQRKRFWFDDLPPGSVRSKQRKQNTASDGATTKNDNSTLPLLNAEIAAALPQEHQPFSQWFYKPDWIESSTAADESKVGSRLWLFFTSDTENQKTVLQAVTGSNEKVIQVFPGDRFQQLDENRFQLRPDEPSDYDQLLKQLNSESRMPNKLVHTWCLSGGDSVRGTDPSWQQELEQAQTRGLYALQALTQAIGRIPLSETIELEIVAGKVYAVEAGEDTAAENATLLGIAKVVPLEYPQLECRLIDCGSELNDQTLSALRSELDSSLEERPWIAIRNGRRLAPGVAEHWLDESTETLDRLKKNGTYLVTGGLGGIGHAVAKFLAETVQANLVLMGRSELPARDNWSESVSDSKTDPGVVTKIKRLQELEAMGGNVLYVAASVADRDQVKGAVAEAVQRFGSIDGVVHSAGVADTAGAIQLRDRQATENQLRSKVAGTLVLEEALRDQKLDFWVLFSSISNTLYHNRYGQLSYVAGNTFLESFASRMRSTGQFAVAIAWDEWQDVGMAAEVVQDFADSFGYTQQLFDPLDSFTPQQGAKMFHRILSSDAATVLISTRDLQQRIDLDIHAKSPFLEAARMADNSEDPSLESQPDMAGESSAKAGYQRIAEMWEKLLSVKSVGPDDNYFALGGDSLSAVRFLNQIEKNFGKRIPFASMVEFPTPSKLADYLQLPDGNSQSVSNIESKAPSQAQESSAEARSTLVELNSGGDLPPLFCMHAADGYVLIFRALCEKLNPNRSIFGLQSPALFGEPIESIEALAARYVSDIRRQRPHGPYHLAGYCMGGTIALEVAQQLKAAGEEVQSLICIETYNWHTSLAASKSRWVKFVYTMQKIDFHFRNFWMLSFKLKRQFLKAKLQAAWRRRKVWFSKRTQETATGEMTFAEIWCRHDEAAEEYKPVDYDGLLTLIRARKDYARYADQPFPIADEGQVELHRLRAYPAGMMAEPFATELAELVEQILD